jgi:hypothetical protein
MLNVKVENVPSLSSYGTVKNQFIITTDEGRYFQSYDSIIAFCPFGGSDEDLKITLDERYWKYSTTTSKYRNQFLGETTKETQAKIDNGTYLLTNLN